MTEKTEAQTRIYKVTTPTGQRLVEATTKNQAIRHCVSGDYVADPVSASEMLQLINSGMTVEKAAEPEKKPAGESKPSSASTTSPASTQLPSSPAPVPSAPVSFGAPAAPAPQLDAVAPQGGTFGKVSQLMQPAATAPQPGAMQPPAALPTHAPVHPVLAEQQKINPDAAAAAGAPAPSGSPVDWEAREQSS